MVDIYFFQEFPEIYRDFLAGMIREYELLLPLWVQTVEVRLDKTGQNWCSMSLGKDYRRMLLNVSTDLFAEDPDYQREQILHEIVHCHNTQPGDVAFEILNIMLPNGAEAEDVAAKQLYQVLSTKIRESIESADSDFTYSILRYTSDLLSDRPGGKEFVSEVEQ